MATSPNTFSKNRLEALSDGLFAIAMALLVLEIKAPAGVAPGGLQAALAHATHSRRRSTSSIKSSSRRS
jgi:uncharacterized membrane protein